MFRINGLFQFCKAEHYIYAETVFDICVEKLNKILPRNLFLFPNPQIFVRILECVFRN